MSWRIFGRFRPRVMSERGATRQRRVYPKNAPGDFYVEESCCLTCGIPWSEAPDHFAVDDVQCYIKRQPANEAEVRNMVSAMAAQELDCIRYKGRDPQIVAAIRVKTRGNLVDD